VSLVKRGCRGYIPYLNIKTLLLKGGVLSIQPYLKIDKIIDIVFGFVVFYF
jgi:hypothetical protein